MINHCDRRITQFLGDIDTVQIQYSQRHAMINQCDRRTTLLSDTDTVQSETYYDKSL